MKIEVLNHDFNCATCGTVEVNDFTLTALNTAINKALRSAWWCPIKLEIRINDKTVCKDCKQYVEFINGYAYIPEKFKNIFDINDNKFPSEFESEEEWRIDVEMGYIP